MSSDSNAANHIFTYDLQHESQKLNVFKNNNFLHNVTLTY